ncbi:putative transcription factor interactor and regulator CCHC(Zn) family [Helianthus annuus]|nr:putative transcription factor interactor and regulator CCHC(Zn) family [Helianthus annuus]
MVQLPSCTCNASKEFNDFNQLIKLMQFLMGLDEIYQPVRTSLLTRDPLPSIKTAFSIVSREESHKGGNTPAKGQNVGFVSKFNQTYENKKKFNKGPNPNLKCTNCNKVGHTVDRCYELVGYPQGYKSKFGQGNSQGNRVNKSMSNKPVTDVPSSSSTSPTPSLTSDQITQLLGLLKAKNNEGSQNANFGGNSIGLFSLNIFCKPIFGFASGPSGISSGWIVDSGASQHMVMSDKGLINRVDVSNFNISIKHPNGTNAKVTKIGCLK